MKDRHYERRLGELDIAHEYVERVQLSDVVDSVQARVMTEGEIAEEVRRHEVNARQSGTTHYPPLVLGVRSDGKYVLLDGHQRLAGFRRAGVESHDAYLVTNKEDWPLAAVSINTEHGLPPTEEERITLAKDYVRNGMSQSYAAQVFRLSAGVLSECIRADRVEAIAVAEGASARMLEKVPRTTKVYAHKIRRPPVLKAALEAITRSGAKGADAAAIVDRAVSARTDEEAIEALSRIAGVRRSRNGNKPRASTTILTACSRVVTALRTHSATEVDSGDRGRVREACEEAAEALMEYEGALR
jgi:ParB-like chromosome segregation protein Spo0J